MCKKKKGVPHREEKGTAKIHTPQRFPEGIPEPANVIQTKELPHGRVGVRERDHGLMKSTSHKDSGKNS